jgi:hypothetical protein
MKAWDEHYATGALVEGPDLAIYQVSRPARGCPSYRERGLLGSGLNANGRSVGGNEAHRPSNRERSRTTK